MNELRGWLPIMAPIQMEYFDCSVSLVWLISEE